MQVIEVGPGVVVHENHEVVDTVVVEWNVQGNLRPHVGCHLDITAEHEVCGGDRHPVIAKELRLVGMDDVNVVVSGHGAAIVEEGNAVDDARLADFRGRIDLLRKGVGEKVGTGHVTCLLRARTDIHYSGRAGGVRNHEQSCGLYIGVATDMANQGRGGCGGIHYIECTDVGVVILCPEKLVGVMVESHALHIVGLNSRASHKGGGSVGQTDAIKVPLIVNAEGLSRTVDGKSSEILVSSVNRYDDVRLGRVKTFDNM